MHQNIKKLATLEAKYMKHLNGALSLMGKALRYLHENMLCNY
jgi:hypothetical protein|tara:strand:+ start:213 stop:338 length:126 start_codon:yes stop_codon:yes gene_type:complete